jgi:hypothetical protein
MLFGRWEKIIVDIKWNFVEAECKVIIGKKLKFRFDAIKGEINIKTEV